MLHEFTAEIIRSTEGTFTARLAPFGVPVAYGTGHVEFAAGSILVPPTQAVPLTVDHSGGVLDRIGVMERHFEASDGFYAEFKIADTDAGRDVLELLRLGAVTDVSVGVELADEFKGGVMHGTLDHVAIVAHGRFGKTDKPSKVLAVHDEKEPSMDPTENDEAVAPAVAIYDDSELRKTLAEMEDKLAQFEAKTVEPPAGDPGVFVKAFVAGDDAKLAEFALAQDDTTTAAGIVPDYLASEVLSIVDTARPFVASFASSPIGAAGMNVVYPQVTQKPSVGKQVGEGTQPASQEMTVEDVSYKLDTFAGANKASVQVIERSDPSYVNLFYTEMAGEYAINTEQAALTTLAAAVTQTVSLPDASADPGATIAALASANTLIIKGVRRPGTTVWVGAARWEQFLSLVDSTGRPVVTWPEGSPSNAFGTASLSAMSGTISGLTLRLVPNMLDEDMYIGWSGAAANLEQNPQQLQALRVDTLSYELGVYGYYAFAAKYPKGFVKFLTS